jgi:hypothetical protein
MPKTKFSALTCPPKGSVHTTMYACFRIADKYRNRVPSPAELMEEWGMCHSTACRWIRAMRAARGLA